MFGQIYNPRDVTKFDMLSLENDLQHVAFEVALRHEQRQRAVQPLVRRVEHDAHPRPVLQPLLVPHFSSRLNKDITARCNATARSRMSCDGCRVTDVV